MRSVDIHTITEPNLEKVVGGCDKDGVWQGKTSYVLV